MQFNTHVMHFCSWSDKWEHYIYNGLARTCTTLATEARSLPCYKEHCVSFQPCLDRLQWHSCQIILDSWDVIPLTVKWLGKDNIYDIVIVGLEVYRLRWCVSLAGSKCLITRLTSISYSAKLKTHCERVWDWVRLSMDTVSSSNWWTLNSQSRTKLQYRMAFAIP